MLAVFLIDLSGVLVHLYEQDFDSKFDYPLNGDIRRYMEQLRLGRELEQVSPGLHIGYIEVKCP